MNDRFLQHLIDEAEYGIENSHRADLRSSNNCNAKRQLRLIISAIRQYQGKQDGHPIGWAQPPTGRTNAEEEAS